MGSKMPGPARDSACEGFHTVAEMPQGVRGAKLVQRVELDDSQEAPLISL